VSLGVLSFKYFCLFFVPQGVNLAGFDRHNQRYQSERERGKK